MTRPRGAGPSGHEDADVPREALASGSRIRDRRLERSGTILEHACQYAHPKAAPVFHYLVRWEDGQIEALAETALDGTHGLDVLD